MVVFILRYTYCSFSCFHRVTEFESFKESQGDDRCIISLCLYIHFYVYTNMLILLYVYTYIYVHFSIDIHMKMWTEIFESEVDRRPLYYVFMYIYTHSNYKYVICICICIYFSYIDRVGIC